MLGQLNEQGIGAIGSIAGGLAESIGGMIGQRRRKREQRDARAAYERRLQEFENLDTSNLYGNLTNPFENATVNTQAAEFAAQQQQQGLASTMQAMSGAAGGSGIAALAQSMANVQGQQAQQASADIARQEQANQMKAANARMSIQNAELAGAQASRQAEKDKTSTLLGMSQQRLGAANAARQAATQSIMGGIGGLVGSHGDIIDAGGTGFGDLL